jgi:hypothetical protein
MGLAVVVELFSTATNIQLYAIYKYSFQAIRACNMQPATCSLQHAACNMQHTTCSLQHAACNMQPATSSLQHATCSLQHATCNMQHATALRERLVDGRSMQKAPVRSVPIPRGQRRDSVRAPCAP